MDPCASKPSALQAIPVAAYGNPMAFSQLSAACSFLLNLRPPNMVTIHWETRHVITNDN